MPMQAKGAAMEQKPATAATAARGSDAALGLGAKHAGGRSRLKRLLVRVSAAEWLAGDARDREKEKEEGGGRGVVAGEAVAPAAAASAALVEPSSVCLDRMVLSFMEESNEMKPPRSRCNCFNGNNFDESSDDEFDPFDPPPPGSSAGGAGDAVEVLKGLVQSVTVVERNLLADATRVLDKSKHIKSRAECRRAVVDGLRALGYDVAVCKSKWDKTVSFPAGGHEYIDAVVGDVADGGGSGRCPTRLLVEVDFRSEFEVARSTKAYRAALQAVPVVYVGTAERLERIVAVMADAMRQSLKKKGLHVAPWRRVEYIRSKWLAPHTRVADAAAGAGDLKRAATDASAAAAGAGDLKRAATDAPAAAAAAAGAVEPKPSLAAVDLTGEFELRFSGEVTAKDDRITVTVSPLRPSEPRTRARVVTAGLGAVL